MIVIEMVPLIAQQHFFTIFVCVGFRVMLSRNWMEKIKQFIVHLQTWYVGFLTWMPHFVSRNDIYLRIREAMKIMNHHTGNQIFRTGVSFKSNLTQANCIYCGFRSAAPNHSDLNCSCSDVENTWFPFHHGFVFLSLTCIVACHIVEIQYSFYRSF